MTVHIGRDSSGIMADKALLGFIVKSSANLAPCTVVPDPAGFS